MKVTYTITDQAAYSKVFGIDLSKCKWVNGIIDGSIYIIDTEGVPHHFEGIFTPTEFYRWGIRLTND